MTAHFDLELRVTLSKPAEKSLVEDVAIVSLVFILFGVSDGQEDGSRLA